MNMKQQPWTTVTDGEEIVHACAWCWPGAALVEAFPHLAGKPVSHGMCKPHLADFMKELDANQFKVAPAR